MTVASLRHIVDRTTLEAMSPSKIPWQDPEFSRRMLAEHLDQGHDHASRRSERIDIHVGWLFESALDGRPGSVLDLGCGPGLYTERLAVRGCSCLGVDISPAAIEYARAAAAERALACTYVCADLLTAELGSGHDLAMLLFGELNTFPRAVVPDLLRRVRDALRPGGSLVLEVHTHESVVTAGRSPSIWWSSQGGLLAPGPHVILLEQRWIEESAWTASRTFAVDAITGQVEVYSETLTAYTDDEYRTLLGEAGFIELDFSSTLGGDPHPDLQSITAKAPAGRG